MTEFLATIRRLIAEGDWIVSAHATQELAADGLLIEPLVQAIESAVLVEEYPAYFKGPCILVLLEDDAGQPVHLLWGAANGKERPAALIAAYRPDPAKWMADGLTRRTTP